MRNGNDNKETEAKETVQVLTVPMRNGNEYRDVQIDGYLWFLPYL